jgi:hypothetical protein
MAASSRIALPGSRSPDGQRAALPARLCAALAGRAAMRRASWPRMFWASAHGISCALAGSVRGVRRSMRATGLCVRRRADGGTVECAALRRVPRAGSGERSADGVPCQGTSCVIRRSRGHAWRRPPGRGPGAARAHVLAPCAGAVVERARYSMRARPQRARPRGGSVRGREGPARSTTACAAATAPRRRSGGASVVG